MHLSMQNLGPEMKPANLADYFIWKPANLSLGSQLSRLGRLKDSFRRTATSPGICIQVCPISEEVYGVCQTIRDHPLMAVLDDQIPCVICTESPGLLE